MKHIQFSANTHTDTQTHTHPSRFYNWRAAAGTSFLRLSRGYTGVRGGTYLCDERQVSKVGRPKLIDPL